MHIRLYSFITKFKILYDLQFGFRNNHSTTPATIDIVERIRDALDKGEKVLGIYLDLQKHSTWLITIFLSKSWVTMELGVNVCLGFQVIYQVEVSLVLSIMTGLNVKVSILGYLRALFLNTAFSIITELTFLTTATAWHLTISQSKEWLLRKYLGIVMDNKLAWESHIKYLFDQVIRYTGIFKLISKLLPTVCKKQLYDTNIYSRVQYGMEVFGQTCAKQLKNVQVMQNRLLKILYRLDWLTPQ